MTTLTAIIRKEGSWFVASCPEIGTVSQGRTERSALRNLKEATELYLEELPAGERPTVTTFEVAADAKA